MIKITFLPLVLFGWAAVAATEPITVKPMTVTIRNHVFTPTEIHLQANTAVNIKVKNMDAAAEEFECPGLKVEKVIPAKSELLVHVMPTLKGRYTFIGEYHEKTARGLAVVN